MILLNKPKEKYLIKLLKDIYPKKHLYDIKLKNLSVFYPSANKYQLNNINYQFTSEASIGIIGKNGSGKSTLLLALSSLIPYDGKIICKVDNQKINHKEFCRQFMTIIRNGTELPKDMTLEDYIIENFYQLNIIYDENKKRVLYFLIELLDLLPVAKNTFSAMSLGQQQKCSIIFSILLGKTVLIADEIFRGLDVESQEIIQQLFLLLSKNFEVMLLLTSHNKVDLVKLSDRFVIMDNNTLQSSFKASENLKNNYIVRVKFKEKKATKQIIETVAKSYFKNYVTVIPDFYNDNNTPRFVCNLLINKSVVWYIYDNILNNVLYNIFDKRDISISDISIDEQKIILIETITNILQ